MNCSNIFIDCYLIDQNGFVVISEAHDDTGKFLGVVEAAVMKSMLVQNFFVAVEIYDYQALCPFPVSDERQRPSVRKKILCFLRCFRGDQFKSLIESRDVICLRLHFLPIVHARTRGKSLSPFLLPTEHVINGDAGVSYGLINVRRARNPAVPAIWEIHCDTWEKCCSGCSAD